MYIVVLGIAGVTVDPECLRDDFVARLHPDCEIAFDRQKKAPLVMTADALREALDAYIDDPDDLGEDEDICALFLALKNALAARNYMSTGARLLGDDARAAADNSLHVLCILSI
ncbi:hypothetical protein JCM8202v2_001562 [Rhodotorula sphaerocarpa]